VKFFQKNEEGPIISKNDIVIENLTEYRNLILKVLEVIEAEKPKTIGELISILSKYYKFFDYYVLVYGLTKIFKPKVIVETGVSAGYSSFSILNSFDNEEQILYSIDDNSKSGWIVSDKKQWQFIVGKTENELKPLLEKIKQVDMFCHDSSHDPKVQFAEYLLAWPLVSEFFSRTNL